VKRISQAKKLTAYERRDQGGRSCWFGLSCLSRSSNQTNQIDQKDQMNQFPATRRNMVPDTFIYPP